MQLNEFAKGDMNFYSYKIKIVFIEKPREQPIISDYFRRRKKANTKRAAAAQK